MTDSLDVAVETMVFYYNRQGRQFLTPSRKVANWRSDDGNYYEVIHSKQYSDENL